MDKWLQTDNAEKTRENEPSTSVNISSGPNCAKFWSDDKIQRGVGKSQVKKRKYDDDYIKFGFTFSDQECPKPRWLCTSKQQSQTFSTLPPFGH
jgi:hypothetical protein